MLKLQNELIYNLIGKKLTGQISNDDNDALCDWAESSKEAKDCFEDLKKHWDNIQFSIDIDNLATQEDVRDMIWEKAFK